MAADDINYSINTDDPTCFENNLMTEYQLAKNDIGLTKMQLWKSVNKIPLLVANPSKRRPN